MATSNWGVNSPEAVKLWSRTMFYEALKATYARRFMGRGSNSLLQIADDTSKGPGDRVRVILRMLLSGEGVQGDATLEGQEESLTTYTDDLVINQLRHAVRSGGKMSEQRVPFNVRNEARMGLSDWWADRIDTWFFNQLAGYTAQESTKFTGHQATVAPDANHHYVVNDGTTELVANSAENTIGSASTSNKMVLTAIDKLVTEAKKLSPQIRPIKVNGADHWVMFLHPDQVFDLRTNATAGQVTWYDAQKSAMTGGRVDNNPIFTGALGVYNGVVLHESTRVPFGASGSTTHAQARRAIFCGAQAACMAFGKGDNGGKVSWVEETFDYGNQLGVSGGMISGLKKTRFNSEDFGTLVLSTSWTGA